jgi:hypothetical protein
MLSFPKCVEFFTKVQNRILFDNSKSEDFDVFPYKFWNLCDRIRKNAHTFKILNLGAEFFSFLMQHYFENDKLKNLDIRTVINKIK